jgi:hypothetical protein
MREKYHNLIKSLGRKNSYSSGSKAEDYAAQIERANTVKRLYGSETHD